MSWRCAGRSDPWSWSHDGRRALSHQLVVEACLVQQHDGTRIIGLRDFLSGVTNLWALRVFDDLGSIGVPDFGVLPGRVQFRHLLAALGHNLLEALGLLLPLHGPP